MRSVWVGAVTFGRVRIPVRAYGATEERGTGLNLVHRADGGRIRHRKICEVDGQEVPGEDVARGYVLPDGDVVVLSEDDFATLPLSTSRAIEVQGFAPLADVDPIYFARSYHLEPAPAGTRPYVLFGEALRRSERVAIVKVALRQRESLAVLRMRDQVMVLETMLWPDEVRTPNFPFLHQDVDLEPSEVDEAAALVTRLSEGFTPSRYADGYRAALDALVQAKIDGNHLARPTTVVQRDGAEDLLGALRSTVDARVPRQRTPCL